MEARNLQFFSSPMSWKTWLRNCLLRFLLFCLVACALSMLSGPNAHAISSFGKSSSLRVESHDPAAEGRAVTAPARKKVRTAATRTTRVAGKADTGNTARKETRKARQISDSPARTGAARKAGAPSAGKAGHSARKEAGASARKGQAQQPQPWTFQGGRSAATWGGRGIDGDLLQKKATPGRPAASRKAAAREEQQHRGATDSFSLQVNKERQAWQVSPGSASRADEDVPFESRHRVRALARVEDDDFSFGLGPEVTVRDQMQSNRAFSRNEEPDIDAGVGMQFKLDF